MKSISKIILVSFISLGLTGCGSSFGFFDKDNTPPPSPLVNFKPEAKVNPVWHSTIGAGSGKDYLKLVPVTTETAIFTANNNGKVTATDRVNGRTLWQTQTNITITAGAGAGDNIVVVGSREGDVIALSQANGKTLWTARTSSEILAYPVVANNIAIVKTIDGKVTAYQAQNGHQLWTYQQTEPTLILRGASAPQLTHEDAIIGFANGNLTKLSLRGGNLIWQKTIAIPEGSFAIQRMVDIDADPLIKGQRIYAATYQGRISALDLSTAQDIWTHDISSYTGLTADNSRVYVSDAKSHVWAFDNNNGTVDWRQPQLESRNITGPADMGNYIVVGDGEGYLHWLSKQDGHIVARIRVNSSAIMATPIVYNNILYVLTKNGHLAAYSIG